MLKRMILRAAAFGLLLWTAFVMNGCGNDDKPAAKAGTVDASGKPVDGIKLSKHDRDVQCPSIAVGTDGTIHVAFVEEQEVSPYAYYAYYTSSTDGGATWSDPKNLTEIDLGKQAGFCQMVVDGKNRVYVIWRTSLADLTGGAPMDQYAGGTGFNLVYRVKDGASWSKTVAVNPPAFNAANDKGAFQSFATLDSKGVAHVVWNTQPAHIHTELQDHGSYLGIGNGGLFLDTTLDGASASNGKEIFMPEVVKSTENAAYPLVSRGFGVFTGYVDKANKWHLLANRMYRVGEANPGHPAFALLEDGKEKDAFEIPGSGTLVWQYAPTLLVDAKGRQHAIMMFIGGEHPHIRDMVIGSNDEPVMIRTAKEQKGTIDGMEAFQGPNGKMAVLMQINDKGDSGTGDNFLTVSDGGAWSEPVNLTNNESRVKWAANSKGATSVAVETNMYPGPGAVAFDKDGKPVVVIICKQHDLFGASTLGLEIAGGSTTTPTLRFLRP